MVKRIIHIADLHIPNDVNKRPYSDMVKQLIADILDEIKECESRDEVRVVIVGDIFCQKIRVTNEAMTVFHELLNFLNQMCKTIVVAGNHDMLENNTDRTDSITPTFEINGAYENIIFLDKYLDYKSGYLVDDNIVWVLYSMFDKFAKPNMTKIKKTENNRIIGLYHGEVVGAVTDIGRMSESGIDPKNFKKCDCVMAGHIHKFQELKKGGVPIVYSSSVFQQDAGENISGHGFVVWDVETMTYHHHEVENKHRILKFEISSYDDVTEDEEILINP